MVPTAPKGARLCGSLQRQGIGPHACSCSRSSGYNEGSSSGVDKAKNMLKAVSNAKWGEARTRDGLNYYGVDVDAMGLNKIDPFGIGIKHVQFGGLRNERNSNPTRPW